MTFQAGFGRQSTRAPDSLDYDRTPDEPGRTVDGVGRPADATGFDDDDIAHRSASGRNPVRDNRVGRSHISGSRKGLASGYSTSEVSGW